MAVLDRVPVAAITARARSMTFGRTLLTLIAAILYSLGWATARVSGACWFVLVWTIAAVKEGWAGARRGGGG